MYRLYNSIGICCLKFRYQKQNITEENEGKRPDIVKKTETTI